MASSYPNLRVRKSKALPPDLRGVRLEPTGKLLMLVFGFSVIGGMLGAFLISIIPK